MMLDRVLGCALCAVLCFTSACGSQSKRSPGGQIKLSAKPRVTTAAHASSDADVCATFTLAPYSFDANGKPLAAGAPVTFTTSSASPAVDEILGCNVAVPTYAPPAGALGATTTTPPTLYNWAYLVSANGFRYCSADAGTLDPTTVSPSPAFFAPVNCSASADEELEIDYPISLSAVAQSGYIDISAGVDPIHQYIGCKQAEVVDGGLRFGESFVLDGDPNTPLGLIAFDSASGDPYVTQYGGQTHAADADPNAGALYNTYYTGQVTQATALPVPTTLLQTFLSNSDQSHLFGAGGDSSCAGEWVDSRHALCLTTVDSDPNVSDQDPNKVVTAGTLADAFLYIPGTGYAAASVTSGGATISIYSQMAPNSPADYTASASPAITANATPGFSSAASDPTLTPGAGFNDGLASSILQLSDADPNNGVIRFTGLYIDPLNQGAFIVGESTATDNGWANLSWVGAWAIGAFQPFSTGGVPAGFGASASGCVTPQVACPCWTAALAGEASELQQAGLVGQGLTESPVLFEWSIGYSDQSRFASLLLESEGSDGYVCEGASEAGNTGLLTISTAQWTSCMKTFATTMVQNPCLLNNGAGPCGGATPDCKYISPGQSSCDAIACPFNAAQIVNELSSASFSPPRPDSECTSGTSVDSSGGTYDYVAIQAYSLGGDSFGAAAALDSMNSGSTLAVLSASNPFIEAVNFLDPASATVCQGEVLSACAALGFPMNQPVGCNQNAAACSPSNQVCNLDTNQCGDCFTTCTGAQLCDGTTHTCTQLVFTQQPTSTTSGAAISPAVSVALEDGAGNLLPSTAMVSLATHSGAPLSGASSISVAAVGGIATFSGLTIAAAGSYTLDASSGALAATSDPFSISPGAASQLLFTLQPPSTAQVGNTLSSTVKVSVEDAAGNLVTASNAPITLAASSGGVLTGDTVQTPSGGVALFAPMRLSGPVGIYTLGASNGALVSAPSSSITLAAGAASQLVFTREPPSTAQSGAAFPLPVEVSVEDAAGNLVTASSAPVGLSASGGGAVTPIGAIPHNGVATFSAVTLTGTVGSYTLTAANPSLTSGLSSPVALSAGSVSQLLFTQQPPSTAQSGIAFSQTVKVSVEDGSGNLVTSSSAAVSLTASGGGSLAGGGAQTPVGGVASFSLTLTGAAGSYTLAASNGTLVVAAPSSPIALSAGPASQLVITQQPPSAAISGVPFDQTVNVSVEDASGNLIYSSSAPISLSASSGGALVGAAAQPPTSGVAAFSLALRGVPGTYTLTASNGQLTSSPSSAIGLSVSPPDLNWANWSLPAEPPTGYVIGTGATSGTVADTATGLVWQEPAASATYSWLGAQAYCADLVLGSIAAGQWRLPTVIELLSLVDDTRSNPAMDPDVFSPPPANQFWSLTPVPSFTNVAWFIYSSDGSSYYGFNTNSLYSVRCVH